MLQVHERKLTVAVYCRVSTDKSDQLNSLENQQSFFREYIDKNLNWKFYKIFVDEGLSGTSVKKREGFLQMVKEATENSEQSPRKFDLIVTKEISRFSRNTLDSIYYVRKLKEHGVGVFFLNDNINTLDPDSELRLTIMSSIAQEKTSYGGEWKFDKKTTPPVPYTERDYSVSLFSSIPIKL